MNTQWISFKDRKPSAGDYPIFVCGGFMSISLIDGAWSDDRTHWMPAQLPAPPKKELTQAEKDTAAFDEWYQNAGSCSSAIIWNAALAYERKAIAEIINRPCSPIGRSWYDVGKEIEARIEAAP